MNTGQDGCHVIGRAPAVLQDVETKFACPIHVWMEHLADKFDTRWLVGVLLLEMHHQAKSTIFEGSIGGTNDDGIPRPDRFVSQLIALQEKIRKSQQSLPSHNIICYRRCRDARWRISLHTLVILSNVSGPVKFILATAQREKRENTIKQSCLKTTHLEIAHKTTAGRGRHSGGVSI